MTYPEPTPHRVAEVLARYAGADQYFGADPAVRLVFEQWPENQILEQVWVKVIVLNRLYRTNIYDEQSVARHIQQLNVDGRLQTGDVTVVDDIAEVTFKGGVRKRLYSFATKFCAWHQTEQFQIYDRYVDDVLWCHQAALRFGQFHRHDLKDYPTFLSVLADFRRHFSLTELSCKEIDKYLWIEGRLAVDGVVSDPADSGPE